MEHVDESVVEGVGEAVEGGVGGGEAVPVLCHFSYWLDLFLLC